MSVLFLARHVCSDSGVECCNAISDSDSCGAVTGPLTTRGRGWDGEPDQLGAQLGMYGRTRYRISNHLSDLGSEESSSLYSGSTASTRERLLQGRWRQGSLDGSQDQRDFSDTSSVSTLRNSEPDTFRTYSSTSSLLSPARRARGHRGRPVSPLTGEDFTLLEYKSLSAQDFRKKILREERLALDRDCVSPSTDRYSPTVTIASSLVFSSSNFPGLHLEFQLIQLQSSVSRPDIPSAPSRHARLLK